MYFKIVCSLFVLFSGVVFSMDVGQRSSYELALETYPDLSNPTSKFSKQYEQGYRRMEASNHQMLKFPDCPMLVAGKLAQALMASKKIISPKSDVYQRYLEGQRKGMAFFLFEEELNTAELQNWNTACKTYPHLLTLNNEHAKRLVRLYGQMRESNKSFFSSHEWPKKLADLTFNERLLADGIKKVMVGDDGLTAVERRLEKSLRFDLSEMGIVLNAYPLTVDERNLIKEKTKVVRELRANKREIDSIERDLLQPDACCTSNGQNLSGQDCERKLRQLLERNQLLEQKKSLDADELKSKLSLRMR